MRLIFVLIVQYSMGLLMGVLRMFALRSVLESLLLFLPPDLGVPWNRRSLRCE